MCLLIFFGFACDFIMSNAQEDLNLTSESNFTLKLDGCREMAGTNLEEHYRAKALAKVRVL